MTSTAYGRLLPRRQSAGGLWVRAVVVLAVSCILALGIVATAAAAPGDLTLTITNVDVSAFPSMSAVVQLGGPMAAQLGPLTKDAFAVQLDGKQVPAQVVEATPSISLPTETVLLIDESGSMGGDAINAAAAAARRFIAGMRPGDTAAIQAFNVGFRTLHTFSGDQAGLTGSLGGLAPQKETALYDALLKALSSFGPATQPNSRYLILLSDGGDTASVARLDQAVVASRSSDIQIYTVGLKTKEFDSQPLVRIAEASGGRYLETPDPAALTSLYEALAKEIHNQYLLTFASTTAAGGAGKVLIGIGVGGVTAQGERGFFYPAAVSTTTTAAAPSSTAAPVTGGAQTSSGGPSLTTRFLRWEGSDYTVGVVMFALVFAVFYLVSGAVFPRRNVLKEYGDVLEHRRNLGPRPVDEVKSRPGLAQRATQRLLGVRGYDHPLQRLIDDAGLKFRASEFAFLHFVGVVVVAVVVRLAGAPVALVVVAAFVVVVFPLFYLDLRGKARKRAFEAQVPNTLVLLSGSLRAGQGFEQAIMVAANEAPDPTAFELRRVLVQQRLGVSPEEALRDIASRMKSEAFDWVVMATIIQRQVGGNLAEIYESIAETLRERAKMGRQIRTLTAEGRLSAVILLILPFGVAAVFTLVNREYLALLWQTLAGWVMLGAAVLLMVVGTLWLRVITKVDA